ncbi:MAG: hypothetical protein P4L42_06380 [Desulfocapsaceae bacterium]|nr:hypothetical protein [Desulfocapsaceae bacterium]
MKKIMFMAVLLLLTSVAVSFAGDVDGFRGKKWGTPISEFKRSQQLEMRQNDGVNRYVFYAIINDTLKVRGINVESIRYFFWKDKFAGVSIVAKGENRFNALQEAVNERFGLGKSGVGPSGEHIMTWDSEPTRANLSFNSETGKVQLVLLSRMLDALKSEMDTDRDRPAEGGDYRPNEYKSNDSRVQDTNDF